MVCYLPFHLKGEVRLIFFDKRKEVPNIASLDHVWLPDRISCEPAIDIFFNASEDCVHEICKIVI